MLVSHDVTAIGRVDGSGKRGALTTMGLVMAAGTEAMMGLLMTAGTDVVIGLVMAAGGTLASKFLAIIESLNVALGWIGCVSAVTDLPMLSVERQ